MALVFVTLSLTVNETLKWLSPLNQLSVCLQHANLQPGGHAHQGMNVQCIAEPEPR